MGGAASSIHQRFIHYGAWAKPVNGLIGFLLVPNLLSTTDAFSSTEVSGSIKQKKIKLTLDSHDALLSVSLLPLSYLELLGVQAS